MEQTNLVGNDVVQRAQAGDPEACREIIERLHQPMLGFIYRMLGPNYRDQMEDIAQDVFLKVFRSIERFEVERGVKFSTWVFTFTRNHCLDLMKKRRLKTISMSQAGEDATPRDFADEATRTPEQLAGSIEIGARIDAALASINPEQREVFELRERRGMEYTDIAKRMGVAEGTVKSRLHRARLALRELLADLAPSQRGPILAA
ncbi:MAG: sigma-70 family RNA polymerase sigma factor [Planctomycetes bacterium]|nr:sigma-70 family RNA polymerase sigma factor [Planctomycetota bacterium]MCB9869163.1 sigma-70 family RNA polymerase sigma factor [Planctomycetota bacterium]MCB9889002.1 sigma-70 family RNA polymerase sigma factor [Planctomycetota bacterium]